MTLYRLNLKISQESFTKKSCFEVAIRNAIVKHYESIYGNEWLRNAQMAGGIFAVNRFRITRRIIALAYTNVRINILTTNSLLKWIFGFGDFYLLNLNSLQQVNLY